MSYYRDKNGIHICTLIYNFAENWPQENSEMRERFEKWRETDK